MLIDSTETGINLWFAPQISEHCPKNSPGLLLAWFSRPEVASIVDINVGNLILVYFQSSNSMCHIKLKVIYNPDFMLYKSRFRNRHQN